METTKNTTFVVQIKWEEDEWKDYMSFAFFEDADDATWGIAATCRIIKRTVVKTVQTTEEVIN